MREKREPAQLLGTVKRLLAEEGYGFIEGDDGGDYFFHARGVRGKGFDNSERFFEGARVRFIASDTPKGPRALNVQALEGSSLEVDENREVPAVVAEPEEDERG